MLGACWRWIFGPGFWLPSYLALILGFSLPEGLFPQPLMRGLVPLFLAGILFFSGLRLPLADLTGGLREISLLRGLAVQLPVKLLLIPLLAYTLALLLLPAWSGGVLLVSLMPMGLTSIAFADLYGGHRVLAVLQVLFSSVLAPLSIPLMLLLLGHAGLDGIPLMPLLERTLYIVTLLFVPISAAQICRRFFPHRVLRHHDSWNAWAIFCSCALIFASVVGTQASWGMLSWIEFMPALLATFVGSFAALLGSLMLWPWLSRDRALAFAIGAVYMNNGLAVAFALRFFPDQANMLLPSVLMQFPMVGLTALVGNWAQGRERRRKRQAIALRESS